MSTGKTLGELRVRIDFNVSNDTDVSLVKSQTAGLINFLEKMKPKGITIETEQLRLIALAQTAYEDAAMWAVKAITY
jgi:hypothetical protein